jgi:hypothetical protein
MEPVSDQEHAVIEGARRLYRKVGIELAARGVTPADNAISAVYAAHDLALNLTGSVSAGIDWMRDALDIMEQQALKGVRHERPN